jgi:hypothetical protein
MSETVQKINDTTFQITTENEHGTTIVTYTVDQLLNRKQLLETRIQSFDARLIVDRGMLVGRLADNAALVQKAVDAGCVVPE